MYCIDILRHILLKNLFISGILLMDNEYLLAFTYAIVNNYQNIVYQIQI